MINIPSTVSVRLGTELLTIYGILALSAAIITR